MKPSFTVDDSGFAETLREYRELMKRDLPAVLKQQAKLYLRDVLKFMKAENLKTGRMRVERDILRVFRSGKGNARLTAIELVNNPERMEKFVSGYKSQGIADSIRRLSRANKTTALAKLLERAAPSTSRGLEQEARTPSPAMHAALRKRGSVSRHVRGYAYTGKQSDLRRYIKAEQAKVGQAKGGWVEAANAVGLSVPAYVRKAARGNGYVRPDWKEQNPSILIGNADAAAVQQAKQFNILERAYAQRVRDMESVIDRINTRNAQRASK